MTDVQGVTPPHKNKVIQRVKNAGRKAGFTLIELSIVLVGIGFLAGAILVGQDL